MEGQKLTRGRQKIEIKKIQNEDDRLITFSKRRSGVYKKASELVTLCGAEIGVMVFSPAGKPFSFANPSLESVTNKFLNLNPPPNDNTHPLVEAHRRVRINELNHQHNDLLSHLETEKENGKSLQKVKSVRAGGTQQGWWESPVEEIGLEELHKLDDNLENLHKDVAHYLKERGVDCNNISAPSYSFDHVNVDRLEHYPFTDHANIGGFDPSASAAAAAFPPSFDFTGFNNY